MHRLKFEKKKNRPPIRYTVVRINLSRDIIMQILFNVI